MPKTVSLTPTEQILLLVSQKQKLIQICYRVKDKLSYSLSPRERLLLINQLDSVIEETNV